MNQTCRNSSIPKLVSSIKTKRIWLLLNKIIYLFLKNTHQKDLIDNHRLIINHGYLSVWLMWLLPSCQLQSGTWFIIWEPWLCKTCSFLLSSLIPPPPNKCPNIVYLVFHGCIFFTYSPVVLSLPPSSLCAAPQQIVSFFEFIGKI